MFKYETIQEKNQKEKIQKKKDQKEKKEKVLNSKEQKEKEKKEKEQKNLSTFLFSKDTRAKLSLYFSYLKELQKEHNKLLKDTDSFFSTNQRHYNCILSLESLILKYCLGISYFIKNHNLDLAHQIFLLMVQENKKSFTFFYTNISRNIKNLTKNSNILIYYPRIMLIYLRILCCLIKFSDKFSACILIKSLLKEYLDIIHKFCKVPLANYIERGKNLTFLQSLLLFNFSIYKVKRFSPMRIPIMALERVKELFDNLSNNYKKEETQLLTKVYYNLGIFYYVNGINKEAENNISNGEKLFLLKYPDIFNEPTEEKKSHYTNVHSENNIDKKREYHRNDTYKTVQMKTERRISAIESRTNNKINLKEGEMLMKIELALGEIYLDNKQYILAYEHVEYALALFKNYTLLQKKKNHLSRYIYFFLEEIQKQYEEDNLIEKKRNNSPNKEKPNLLKRPINESTFQTIKEMEKFCIFLNTLSIFQIKKLNDFQPKSKELRNSIPIVFSNQFKDCLNHSQRLYLSTLSGTLSRYTLLNDPNKGIYPGNLNFDILTLKERRIRFTEKSKSQLKVVKPKHEIESNELLESLKNSNKMTPRMERFFNKNSNCKLAIKILKKMTKEEVNELIENPKLLIDSIKKYVNESNYFINYDVEEESISEDNEEGINDNNDNCSNDMEMNDLGLECSINENVNVNEDESENESENDNKISSDNEQQNSEISFDNNELNKEENNSEELIS